MYARGMTVREIPVSSADITPWDRAKPDGHLAELYGIDVSPDLISAVTDAILDEIAEWQNRPLEAVYPLVFAPTVARRSWACGSSRPRVRSSGCG